MQHVFIVGSKGIPGTYGGYETFVDKLTEYHQNHSYLKYHVACKSDEKGEFEYHNARCFKIKVPHMGSAQAIYYDLVALLNCCRYIKKTHINHPIVYILACHIGPMAAWFQWKIHKLGGVVYINPDGHEYLRAKWPFHVRKYWKLSERLMVKYSDLIICDNKNIEKYILECYKKYCPRTKFIAYGADVEPSILADNDEKVVSWFKKRNLKLKKYYLMVGRFVPENNFETIIQEFMKSKSEYDLAIITTIDDCFMKKLERKLHFSDDARIKFVGTVYDQELLKKIRENAYGYIHGHEVGGTNPSLLEALGSTELNLLLNVGFNKEVGGDGAIYWGKQQGELAQIIDTMETLDINRIKELGMKAKKRIAEEYTWKKISDLYENIFLNKAVSLGRKKHYES